MNVTNYSCILAKYNGSLAKCVSTEVIGIPLVDEKDMKYGIIKMSSLSKRVWMDCVTKRPLVRSLQIYFNTRPIASVFHGKLLASHTWTVLLSNTTVVYPQAEGQTLLTLTPYFVKDSRLKAFKRYITGAPLQATSSAYDNIYMLDNMVLFLDPYQVPYPGGTYFDDHQRKSEWYRICYLGRRSDGRHEQMTELMIQQKYLVMHTPNKCRSLRAYVSELIRLPDPYSLMGLHLPEEHAHKSGTISKAKCVQSPNFILQDVLDSYGYVNPTASEVGIIIETPITISFEYNLGDVYRPNVGGFVDRKRHHDNVGGEERYFETYAINCIRPRTVLFVPKPYDHYIEYMQVPKHVDRWTTLSYDAKQENLMFMNTVVFDHSIVGYYHRDVFFCLSDVQLPSAVSSDRFAFMDKMLNTVKESDIENMSEFTLLNKYELTKSLTLHRLKHRKVRNQLWCISHKEKDMDDDDETKQTYSHIRRPQIPALVHEWVNMVVETRSAKTFDHDIDITKLLYVLTKHKNCTNLRVVQNEETRDKFVIEEGKSIVFHVNKYLYEFINKLRFDDNGDGGNESSKFCVIC